MGKRIRHILGAALALALALSAAAPAAAADGKTAKTREVRVAYPIQQNLSEMDEDGRYSGYLTDYMEMIAEVAGWNITYVTYPGLSLNAQMMKALEDVETGDADLLGGVLYSDAVAKRCLYPENSCGAVYTTLETLETNYKLKDTNYMEKPALRVAVLEKAVSRNQEVASFAKKHGNYS